MKQTYTIRLTPETHTSIKEMALSNNQSLSEFIEDHLKRVIETSNTDIDTIPIKTTVEQDQQPKTYQQPKTREEIIDEVVDSLPTIRTDLWPDAELEPEEQLEQPTPIQFY